MYPDGWFKDSTNWSMALVVGAWTLLRVCAGLEFSSKILDASRANALIPLNMQKDADGTELLTPLSQDVDDRVMNFAIMLRGFPVDAQPLGNHTAS